MGSNDTNDLNDTNDPKVYIAKTAEIIRKRIVSANKLSREILQKVGNINTTTGNTLNTAKNRISEIMNNKHN
jgi:hypothetical protein